MRILKVLGYLVSILLCILLLSILPEFAFSLAGGMAIGWIFVGGYFMFRLAITGRSFLE